jgi:hypothetical protein
MSVATAERKRIHPRLDQLALRTLVLVGVAAAIVAAQAAGARPGPWEQGVVLGLTSITAVRPESIAGVGMLAGAAYIWALAPETLSPLVLVAAAGMILAHVSALVAAQGPARMGVDGVQVRRWAARGLLLWLAAAAVWGLSVAVVDLPQRRLAYALGLTVLTVVALAATRLVGSRAERAGR